jgi:class 3 adenylate cyclase
MQYPSERASACEAKELQLFVEITCCDLLRFEHSADSSTAPEQVQIAQEFYLGAPGAHADMQVRAPGIEPYFVEVKYGYTPERLIESMVRKYGRKAALQQVSKILVVIDANLAENWKSIESELKPQLHAGLNLEVWDEEMLLSLLRQRFDVNLTHLSLNNVHEVRAAIDAAKREYAFGNGSSDPLYESLLWHFSFWQLRRIRVENSVDSRNIFNPGSYRDVSVIFADLSGFSSFVRDTRDDAVVRYILTTFYTKARYEIVNRGGMLYQFAGDGVLAVFGLFDSGRSHLQTALECARSLIQIGNSVTNEWQRQIDHIQSSHGSHVGIARGDLQFMSLRPFSRTHIGAIGDCINLAARLCSAATAGEIVVSNTFYQWLSGAVQAEFQETQPVDAKNMGRVRTWKLKYSMLPGS